MLVTERIAIVYFTIVNVLAFIIFLLSLFVLTPTLSTIDISINFLPIVAIVIFSNLGAFAFSTITLIIHELAHIQTIENLGYTPVLVLKSPAIHVFSRNIESISDIRRISLAGPIIDILVIFIVGIVIIVYPTNNLLLGILLLSILSHNIKDFLSSNLPLEGNDFSIALQNNSKLNKKPRRYASPMNLLQLIYMWIILAYLQILGIVFLVIVVSTRLGPLHRGRSEITFRILRGLKNDIRAYSID